MDERIKEHLKLLNKYYLQLSNIRNISKDIFFDDPIYQAASERYLQLAIESCLNIGNRIISLYQFQKPISTPETYADIFQEMRKLDLFDDDFTKKLVRMAKFRNRLVHLYWEVDNETLYRIIQNDLDDFKIFQDQVVEFLNTNKLKDS